MTSPTTKCGFVALIGAPNAGKSTLMNRLVGQKVSIVTHKAQTTRSRITGIVLRGDTQIIFHDLPGVFDPENNFGSPKFEKAMVGAAWSALSDADLGLVIVDASKPLTSRPTAHLLKRLGEWADHKVPLALVLNKADLVDKEKLLPFAQAVNEQIECAATFMISAKNGTGCDELLIHLEQALPEGPFLYDEDDVTDLPAKLLAAEFTREQVFKHLHQEIPYGIMVQTEGLAEDEKGTLHLDQVIFVRRDNHKGIVIGKGGQTLKRIGSASRRALEKVFDQKVHLNVLVRVKENWDNDPETFEMWGLE